MLFTIVFFAVLIFSFSIFLKTNAHQVINDLEQKYFLLSSQNMQVLETEHFIIRFEDKEEEARLTANIAEKYYTLLSARFEYEANEKIPIIIYQDAEKMKKTAFMKSERTPMGLYIGKTIQILSPSNWINSEDHKAEIFEKEGPVIHEMVHYIVDDITKGNYEEWFFEGMSLYTEYLYTGYMISNDEYETIYSIDDLEKNFRKLDQAKAYYSSFMLVKKMAEENNFEYLNNVLQCLRNDNDLNGADFI